MQPRQSTCLPPPLPPELACHPTPNHPPTGLPSGWPPQAPPGTAPSFSLLPLLSHHPLHPLAAAYHQILRCSPPSSPSNPLLTFITIFCIFQFITMLASSSATRNSGLPPSPHFRPGLHRLLPRHPRLRRHHQHHAASPETLKRLQSLPPHRPCVNIPPTCPDGHSPPPPSASKNSPRRKVRRTPSVLSGAPFPGASPCASVSLFYIILSPPTPSPSLRASPPSSHHLITLWHIYNKLLHTLPRICSSTFSLPPPPHRQIHSPPLLK